MADSPELPGSIVVGEGVLAKGTFKVPGRAVINGSVEGELIAKDVFIGPSGRAIGKFKAEMADIRGEVHDTLVTTGSLIIRSSGKITGTVIYKEVEIEKGGEMEGKMSQGSDVPAVTFSLESAEQPQPIRPAVKPSAPAVKG